MATRVLQRTTKLAQVDDLVVTTTVSTTAVKAVHPVEVAVRAFEDKRTALLAFMDKYAEVFQKFDAYASEYNAAADEAKAVFKASGEIPVGTHCGDFSRKKAATSVSYTKALLPAEVLSLAGVLVVDKGVLEALVKAGVVPEASIAAAKVTTTGTAAIEGPGKISLKIGGGAQ